MKMLKAQPRLDEQVHEAILQEITSGKLLPGARIIQETIAQELGVSRQPVQQALSLLRNQGLLRDAPGRGLVVAPLDPDHIAAMYDMRAVIEGLACRKAAERNALAVREKGMALIERGRAAVDRGSVSDMVAADIALHEFIYAMSENPLIAPAMSMHWHYTKRVMGEVLMRDELPRHIWDQHETIIAAIGAGDGPAAERTARDHILSAAERLVQRLRSAGEHS